MKYIDDENYVNEIKNAINSSVASLNIDGINVSEEERKNVEDKLLKDENIKTLLRRKNHQKGENKNG